MNRFVMFSAGVGVLLFSSIATPVYSQTNTSNSSGTNTSNATGINVNNLPGFPSSGGGSVGGYNQQVLNQAQQLANELKAAEQAYNQAEQEAAQRPQRYSRRPCDCDCVNPHKAAYEQAKAKAQNFLESLKNPKPEQLQLKPVGSRQPW